MAIFPFVCSIILHNLLEKNRENIELYAYIYFGLISKTLYCFILGQHIQQYETIRNASDEYLAFPLKIMHLDMSLIIN